MGLFSSSSKTQQTQNTSNLSQQISTGENSSGAVVTGSGNTLITTDGGAINSAFGFASGLADNYANLLLEQSDKAFSLVGGAVTSINEAQDNSYQFSAGITQQAINAVVASVDGQRETLGDVLNYGAGISMAAFEAANKARDEAFGFAAGAFKEAASQQAAALQAQQAAAEASYAAQANAANQIAAQANASRQDTLQFAAGSLEAVVDASKSYGQSLSDFAALTVKTAVDSTKSEAQQTQEKILNLTGDTVKYILGGAGLVVALTLFTRR